MFNYLGKCTECQKNEAVVLVRRRDAEPAESKALCLVCANKLHIPEIRQILSHWGGDSDDVEQMQQQVNNFFAGMTEENMESIMEMSKELAQFSNMDELQEAIEDGSLNDVMEEIANNPEFEKFFSQPQINLNIYGPNEDEEEDKDDDKQAPEEPKNKKMSLQNLFKSWAENDEPEPVAANKRRTSRRPRQQQYKFLQQFGINLNERAREHKIDPIVGREKELARMAQILNRRQKNNPALIGEPGVGKTAIAEGLAKRIVEKQVPAKLLDKELYLIDMSSMVAGTQFRGQFESRLKGLIEDAKNAGNVILVIDEVHNIVSAGDSEGGLNAANILKPALAKGEISVIGSTTLEEYRKTIEKDSALERRFQKLMVEEPSPEETFDILQGLKGHYEDHHYVEYPDETLGAAIRLSQRYLNERFLPDKAIDILDEAGSRQNLNNEILVKLRERELELELVERRYKELAEIDVAKLEDEKEKEAIFKRRAMTQQQMKILENDITALQGQLERHVVSVDDVADVIEMWTGVPVKQITESENSKLLNLEDRLRERVIGQEAALDALSRAVRRKRAGFGKHKKPASFLFVGPTGVGKTEVVKALTEALFDTEDNLIRLDMSEYMEAHTVAKLIGSPPGYVGYDDGGQLSEKVRRHPYSVILLDEIEKAHADVYNILLQILDDGRLTDSQGRVVNFENTVIVMTSNAGTSLKNHGIGFARDSRPAMEDHIKSALRDLFRPEFLNRIDEIIIFNELTQDDLYLIVDLMLKDVVRDLKLKGIAFEITDPAKRELAERGYDPKFGARPLRRLIQKTIEDELAERYFLGELAGKKKVKVALRDGEFTFLFEE